MSTPQPTPGSIAFQAFLTAHKIKDPAAAEALDTSDVSIYQWRTGRARPSPLFQEKLRRWADIEPSSWLYDAESAEAGGVTRFVAGNG